MKLRLSAPILSACVLFATPAFAEDAVASEEASTNETTGEPKEELTVETRDETETEETEAAARDAFHRGDRMYLEGDYEGAVVAFEQAYSLSGRIEMLFNLANAHERLGNYSEASVALRGYIPHSPEADRPALERRLERFEAMAKKRRDDTEETVRTVKELQENPRPFPVKRAVGIGLVTLGGAAIITGTGFAISAGAARSDLSDLCQKEGSSRLCPAEAEQTLMRDKTHSLIADVSWATGAVLAAVGVYLVVYEDEKPAPSTEVKAGVSGNGVWLGGTF